MTIPLAWLADRHQAVLVTLKSDGAPQTSNIMFALVDGVAKVSVTDDRAKTRNLRRDPRGVLHVLGDTFWQYGSVSVTADASEVTTEPGDAAGEELLEVYEAITGKPHPNPQEFFEAMVAERRLVLRLTPVSAVSQGVPE
jgi:PPOX class probable F420-dependent enzyme